MLTGPEITSRKGAPPKRLVLLFHGLGADGQNLIDIATILNRFLPDTHFISPNAPFAFDEGSSGYQWFSRRDRSFETAIAGLRTVEPIVNEFVDAQLQRFNLTEKDLAVIGFSQGTMVALHCFLRRPNPVALIVSFSGGLVGPEILSSEIKSKPPVLLIHGESDTVLPLHWMNRSYKSLKANGIEVTARSYPNVGHSINHEGLELATATLREKLLNQNL